jgi:hypothetical protein
MKVKVVGVTKSSYNHSSIRLMTEDGRQIIGMIPRETGHYHLTDDEAEAIVLALLEHLPDEIEIPEREDGYGLKKPAYVAIAEGSATGEVRVPPQVQTNEHGEIIVPPRSKNETPEQKRIRRAARRAKRKMEEAKNAARR